MDRFKARVVLGEYLRTWKADPTSHMRASDTPANRHERKLNDMDVTRRRLQTTITLAKKGKR